jgi:hypothetical protein
MCNGIHWKCTPPNFVILIIFSAISDVVYDPFSENYSVPSYLAQCSVIFPANNLVSLSVAYRNSEIKKRSEDTCNGWEWYTHLGNKKHYKSRSTGLCVEMLAAPYTCRNVCLCSYAFSFKYAVKSAIPIICFSFVFKMHFIKNSRWLVISFRYGLPGECAMRQMAVVLLTMKFLLWFLRLICRLRCNWSCWSRAQLFSGAHGWSIGLPVADLSIRGFDKSSFQMFRWSLYPVRLYRSFFCNNSDWCVLGNLWMIFPSEWW